MTPTGSEQPAKTRGKTGTAIDVPPYVPPSGNINHDANADAEKGKLLKTWRHLEDAGKADLLAVARGLANASKAVSK